MGKRPYRVALALLAVCAGGAAVLVNRSLFPLYSLNRDDSVYVAMARLLEHGSVTLTAADHAAFRPWASAVIGDRIVMKYTPPWPAVLAAGDLVTGSMRAALAVTAAAAVVLAAVLATEVLRDRTAGLVAGVLAAASPVLVVLSGTYLPYVFQLALGLGFAVLLLKGLRRHSTAVVLAAGAVLGMAGWARPFDALLFAVPFTVFAVVDQMRARRREPEGWGWAGCLVRLAAGAAPVVVAALVYDRFVTGSALRLPYAVTGPQDSFGFGQRGVFPQYTIDFTLGDGVDGLLTNLRWVPSWVAGGVVLVVLAAVGLARTRGRARWAVAALAIVVPLGYLFFWGPYAMSRKWPGVELFGFFYHLPVLVPLVVFGAAALVALGRWARTAPRPAVASAAVVVTVTAMLALTVLAVPDKVAGNLAVRDDFRALQRFIDSHHLGTAVLFLPNRGDRGFNSTTPFLENSPSLDQPVLYAEERGAADFSVVDRYPGRGLFRLSEDLAPGQLTGGQLTMERLHVETGPDLTVRLQVPSRTDGSAAVAYVEDGSAELTRPLAAAPAGSGYDVVWQIAAPRATSAGHAIRLPAERFSGVLRVGVAVRGPHAGGERRWEERIPYRLIDGGARLQLLTPGSRWTRDGRAGGTWRQEAAGIRRSDRATLRVLLHADVQTSGQHSVPSASA